MLTAAQAEKKITGEMARSLAVLGFRVGDTYLLERPRPGGVSWQLRCGARKDPLTKKIVLIVSAGLRFEALATLLDHDQEPRAPTVSVPLHLFHEDRAFLEWDAGDSRTVSRLIDEVQRYALPFFERYERLENLLESLEAEDQRKSVPVSRNQRIELAAAVLALLGRSSDALVLLNREIEALENKPPGHRRALERLRAKLH